ncbi:MAG: hypothetical protein DMG65_17690 [Candidatus Angelobacter sp. Gp1-AA117]|nr:MAG: hypothetical protein DMG65_17690 [Candidatus Angelobacter sp. Gp1-AA117]
MQFALKAVKAALLLTAFLAAAQEQTAVEITNEPGHHLVISNAFIRAFDVIVPPKATTLVHRHNYDYVFVTLGDSDITNSRVGAQPVKLQLKDGEVRYTLGGFAHSATNNLDRPFHNTTIELLTKTTNESACTGSCTVEVACKSADKSACPQVQRLLSADQWTVTTLTLPPSATYEQHSHAGSHLSVAVTDLDIRVISQNGQETAVHQKVGDLVWHDPVVHSIRNVGTKPAKIVSLEFKGTAATSSPL